MPTRSESELALAASFLCSTGLLLIPVHANAALRILLGLGAAFGWLAVVASTVRGVRPRRAGIYLTVGLGLGLAMAIPPQGSQDVWSYVMEGRMQTVHDTSPYLGTPVEFRSSDPFAVRVPERWAHTRSPYGPLFSAIEATGSGVARNSPLANRLFYQALAAGAVGLAVLLAPRRRRTTALVVLGACPVTVMIVNGGHNDLIVGLAVASAVWALDRSRIVVAAMALGSAALIKLTAVIALPGVVWWLWWQGRKRAAVGFAVCCTATIGAGYMLAGGMTALRPLLDTGGRTTRASLWSGVHGSIRIGSGSVPLAALLPLLVLAGVSLLVGWRYRDNTSASPMVVGLLVAQIATLPWLLPWYVGWILPSAATRPSDEPSRLAMLLIAVLVVAYAVPPGLSRPSAVMVISHAAIPIFLFAAVWTMTSGSSRQMLPTP